jgi:MoxR-like ATPase
MTPSGAADALSRTAEAVQQVVRGKDAIIELSLVAVLAGGHVLLEDIPGVGKTTLASTLAAVLGGSFRRIQFTSDLLPGDITGVNILTDEGFRFRPGPVFANFVLADEINRATPKTQSALLEAMSERRVTVDGHSHPLPGLFIVLATQNPHDFHGTFPLPESQLDRFLIRLSMGYPDRENERLILRRTGRREPVAAVLSPTELLGMSALVEQVRVPGEVEDYLLDFVEQTRQDARLLRGLSTRGAEALYRACQALALVRRRDFVVFEDIIQLAVPVAGHRVRARSMGERPGEGARRAILEILRDLPAPL